MISGRYGGVALALLASWYGTQVAGSAAADANRVYEDDRIRVAVPENWTFKKLFENAQNKRSPADLMGVVLSDGPFDLFMLTHYGQASGIVGGRFGEVSKYVTPWLKTDDPWGCISIFRQRRKQVSKDIARIDLTLDPKRRVAFNDPSCAAVEQHVSRQVWGGSYFGFSTDKRPPGFFLSATPGADQVTPENEMVFAASYRTTDLARLPRDGDERVKAFLEKSSRVIAGVRYKHSAH